MTTDRLVYTTARADRHREWLNRTATACIELSERYVELHGRIISGQGETGVTFSTTSGYGKTPVRIGVLDAIRDVEDVTGHHVSLAHGALKLGTTTTLNGDAQHGAHDWRLTVKSLRWLSVALGPVFDADPDTARDAARAIWRQHHKTGSLLGIDPHPFRVSDDCPECGNGSLWADPQTWTVACGMPGCAFKVPVNAPILRWSS